MRIVRVAVLAIASLLVASSAEAGQGYFGGRTHEDGLVNVRRSTTVQFEPIRGQSVAQRARPDFDPTPLSLGSFQAFPALAFSTGYNSNIYGKQLNKNSDFIYKVNPSLNVASNWGRHAIAFTGFGDMNMFAESTGEDFNSGVAKLEGRYDISAQTWVAGDVGYQRSTEPRGSSDVIGAAATPTQFNTYSTGAEVYRGVGSLKAKLGYDLNYREYDNVQLVGGGTAIQSGRNRVNNKISGRVDYDVTENLKPFVRGSFDWMDYTATTTRSSHGYGADVGAKMDFGGVTTGEAYVGYSARDYYNFGTGVADALNFGMDALWNVTELTSIQGEVSRSINETTLGGSTAAIETGGSITATHELQRNLIVEANLSFTNNDFNGVARNDDNYGVGMGGRYYINRNLYSDLTYDFVKRTSNVPDSGYDRHAVLVRLGAQY